MPKDHPPVYLPRAELARLQRLFGRIPKQLPRLPAWFDRDIPAEVQREYQHRRQQQYERAQQGPKFSLERRRHLELRRDRQLTPKVYQRWLRWQAKRWGPATTRIDAPEPDIIDRANGANQAAAAAAAAAQAAAANAQIAALTQAIQRLAERPADRPSLEPAPLVEASPPEPSPPEPAPARDLEQWQVPERWWQWPARARAVRDLRKVFPEHFHGFSNAFPNLPTSLKQLKPAAILAGLKAKELPGIATTTLWELRTDVSDDDA